MSSFATQGVVVLKGTVRLRGDKSIAHRAIMLAGISEGTTTILNFPIHDDAAVTLRAFRSLGVKIKKKKDKVIVRGVGLRGLQLPDGALNVFESGTTLRLLLGILAGQSSTVSLVSDPSLSRRPMLRVTKPLRAMGVRIRGRKSGKEEYTPLTITGGFVEPITYKMPMGSAQVKSAILLAGLYAHGTTRVIEPVATRDHTERMLRLFGARIKQKKHTISLSGCVGLRSPGTIVIPGDVSSAGFFLVAASLLAGSRLVIRAVSLNSTRTGIIDVLRKMGSHLRVTAKKGGRGEPFGDITVEAGPLHAITINKKDIPLLIDELPIIMVAACFACGKTILKGIEELRFKETDRVRSMTDNLSRMGACVEVVKQLLTAPDSLTSSRDKRGMTALDYAKEAALLEVDGPCANIINLLHKYDKNDSTVASHLD